MATSPLSDSDRVEAGTNVLLVAPPDVEDAACVDLLTAEGAPPDALLSVTYVQSADERVDVWGTHRDEYPSEAVVLTVNETPRSATTPAAGATDAPPTTDVRGVAVEPIESVRDLAGLGVAITEHFQAWGADDVHPVVCFHSLTFLLERVDHERAFQFLHLLTAQVRNADGIAHFHVDPAALDRPTIDTFRSLMDVVVEWDATDDWTVRPRSSDEP